MTSIVFTQFDNDLPVDINRHYYINKYDTDTGFTILHKMCLFPEKLREYLRHLAQLGSNLENIDFNCTTTKFKFSPLLLASYNNIDESVKILIEYQSDNFELSSININLQDFDGYTTLMYEGISENIENIKLLLENGADVNLTDDDGDTVFIYVQHNIQILKLLLEYGLELTYRMFEHVCCYRKIRIIKLFLQYTDIIYYDCSFIMNIEHSVYIQLTNINNEHINTLTQLLNCNYIRNVNNLLRKLKHFDYNSILLYELKKCVF